MIKLPYDHSKQQVTADGSKAGLNVGAVLVLPEGFKIAPEDRLSEELKEKLKISITNPTAILKRILF